MMKRMDAFFQHGSAQVRCWKRVLGLLWQCCPLPVTWLFLLTLLTGVIPALQIQVTASVVQSAAEAIRGGRSPQLVTAAVFFGIAQGGLALALLLLSTGQQYYETVVKTKLINYINLLILSKSVSLDLQHYEDDTFYDQLQRAVTESGYRPYQICLQMTLLFSKVATLLSVAAALIQWNWWIGLLIFLSPIPSVCSQAFFSQKGYQIERERAAGRRQLSYIQQLVTSASSFKELRLFHLGDLFVTWYRIISKRFSLIDITLAKRYSLVSSLLGCFSILVMSGAQIYAILFAIVSGSVGQLAGYALAIGVVQQNVQEVIYSFGELYQSTLFLGNLFEFLDIPAGSIRGGTLPFPERLQKGIEFRHVSFCYPGTSCAVLSDLNFFLAAGECVALVGQNGAGKTTIVKLLTRLYEPTSGLILIDDIPIEKYDVEGLRKHISVIFQDYIHYEMTVRANIGFGSLDALGDRQRIQEAAEKSGADALVKDLPHAYHTILGRMFENGQELSIGQWQKIALARAFVGNAPVLVLDEPTASIDAEAEAEIFGRLQQGAALATTLLIAHRFSTVRLAHRILVIEHGRVIESGDHKTLMSNKGRYAYLFSLQASGYLDQNDTFPRADENARGVRS